MRGTWQAWLLVLLVPPALSCAGQTNADGDPGAQEAPASSNDTAPRAGGIETRLLFGVAYERLSNGYAPWRNAGLELRMQGATGGGHVAVDETTRFSRADHEVSAGVRRQVSSRLLVSAEAEMSPSHHVSAKWGVLGGVELDAGNGWGLQAGLHHRRYPLTSVNLGTMNVERYLARYRAAYTLYVARLRTGETSISHRVHADFYYGHSSFGMGVSTGEEIENVHPVGLLRTQVRAAAVVGRQSLTDSWFVVYDALVHEQGALYTRRRLSVGVGHRF